METMSKLERFLAVVSGDEVDHPPVSTWLHFVSEHLSGEEAADLHAKFFESYDWDYLKVMHDYRFPRPGFEVVSGPGELENFKPLTVDAPNFSEQLKLLRVLRQRVGKEVPLVETLFDPLQTLVRAAGRGAREVVFTHPEAGHQALQAVSQSLIHYISALQEAGVDAVFYSINGAAKSARAGSGLTGEQFTTFVDPYNRQILDAAQGMVRVAHLHGSDVDFERFVDYPVEVYSWSHFDSPPSLAQARQMTGRALMGGINEGAIAYQSVSEITQDIRNSLEEAGERKFLVGPGCTIPPDSPRRLLEAASRAVKNIH